MCTSYSDPYEHEIPQEIIDFYNSIGQKAPDFINREILDKYIQDVTTANPSYSITPDIIVSYVKCVNNDEDSALNLSVLLTLATDNAKELALAKLNAGINMLGLYVYGISIGMPFSDIANIMMSDIAFEFNDLMSGDVFEDDPNLNFQDIFDYFEIGPKKSLATFNQKGKTLSGRYSNITPLRVLISKIKDANILEFDEDFRFNLNSATQVVHEFTKNGLENYSLLEKFRNEAVDIPNKDLYYRLLDFIEDYMYQQEIRKNSNIEVNGVSYNAYDQIKKLQQGAEELKTLGQILHLNQGLYTTVNESINLINTIEGVIDSAKYRKYKEDKRKNPKASFPSPKPFILNEFLNNPEYRQEQIDEYNKVKASFNILDVISKIPHFNSYISIANLAHQKAMKTSAKYRAIYNLSKPIFKELRAFKTSDKESILKRLEVFVNEYIRRDWMLSELNTINIPKGQVYYDKNDTETVIIEGEEYQSIFGNPIKVTSDNGVPVQLGTRAGDAAFKRLMEQKIIPDLKKGEYGRNRKESFLSKNLFIKGLQPSVFSNTPNYTNILGYSLPINMSPRSIDQKAIFEKYKEAFNELKSCNIKYTIGNKEYDIVELFYMYNQIAYQGKVGEGTLTNIFEDSYDYGCLKRYREFENYFDMNQDITLVSNNTPNGDVTLQELIAWCAPKANPRSTTLEKFYYRDQDTGKMAFWEPYEEESFDSDLILDEDMPKATIINGKSAKILSITDPSKVDVFPVEKFEKQDIVYNFGKKTIEIKHNMENISEIIYDGNKISILDIIQYFSKIPTTMQFMPEDGQLHILYDVESLAKSIEYHQKCGNK